MSSSQDSSEDINPQEDSNWNLEANIEDHAEKDDSLVDEESNTFFESENVISERNEQSKQINLSKNKINENSKQNFSIDKVASMDEDIIQEDDIAFELSNDDFHRKHPSTLSDLISENDSTEGSRTPLRQSLNQINNTHLKEMSVNEEFMSENLLNETEISLANSPKKITIYSSPLNRKPNAPYDEDNLLNDLDEDLSLSNQNSISSKPRKSPKGEYSLEILPDKVLIRIFRYLSAPEELLSVLFTSKKLYKIATHDTLWSKSFLLYRESLFLEQKKVKGLEKKGKDYHKLYVNLKKNNHYYVKRSKLKKKMKKFRRCANFISSLATPILYLISMIFTIVFFGVHRDTSVISKYLVIIPCSITLIIYFVGVISFFLKQTNFFRTCFYNQSQIRQFICISLAPSPLQVTVLCFLFKWGIFDNVKNILWIYSFIPAIISYWIYFCPFLGSLLFDNLKGLHRRRKYIRLKKQHAMELENSVTDTNIQPIDRFQDEYEIRTKMKFLQDPEYAMGNEFYILYFIVFMSIITAGLMLILVPLKLDGIIDAQWATVFIPMWILSGVFIILIPCWCSYEMFLHGDCKWFILTIVPVLVSLTFFASLVLIILKLDNDVLPLSFGLGLFSIWLLIIASIYGCFQSTNLMMKKKIPLQDRRVLGNV